MPNYNRFHVNCYLKATCNILFYIDRNTDRFMNNIFFMVIICQVQHGGTFPLSDLKVGESIHGYSTTPNPYTSGR